MNETSPFSIPSSPLYTLGPWDHLDPPFVPSSFNSPSYEGDPLDFTSSFYPLNSPSNGDTLDLSLNSPSNGNPLDLSYPLNSPSDPIDSEIGSLVDTCTSSFFNDSKCSPTSAPTCAPIGALKEFQRHPMLQIPEVSLVPEVPLDEREIKFLEKLLTILLCLGPNTKENYISYLPVLVDEKTKDWMIAISTGALLCWFPILCEQKKSKNNAYSRVNEPKVNEPKVICSFLQHLVSRSGDKKEMQQVQLSPLVEKCRFYFTFWKVKSKHSYPNVYFIHPNTILDLLKRYPSTCYHGEMSALNVKFGEQKGWFRWNKKCKEGTTIDPFQSPHLAWNLLHKHSLWTELTRQSIYNPDFLKMRCGSCYWTWNWSLAFCENLLYIKKRKREFK